MANKTVTKKAPEIAKANKVLGANASHNFFSETLSVNIIANIITMVMPTAYIIICDKQQNHQRLIIQIFLPLI